MAVLKTSYFPSHFAEKRRNLYHAIDVFYNDSKDLYRA